MLLRDLSWLVAVADHHHVTQAAVALHTSQPTLSRTVARVEAELGLRVFERVPSGVVVTPNGQLVVDAARALTTRYEQLQADLEGALHPDTGVLRLAFLDSMATSLVPRLLRAFHEHAPSVRILLRQEPHHQIVDDLDSGAADLAVTSSRPSRGFGWVALQTERLVLVVPSGHRLAQRTEVSLGELADERLVTTPVGFGYRTLVDGLLRAAGVAPVVSFESQDLATIEGLVAAGLGVALVPEPFAGQSGTVGIRLTAKAARRTIGLTWRADRDLARPAVRFRDFVASSYGLGGSA